MAFKNQINELKGFFLLVLFVVSSPVSANIDCGGKPFHCVNSTHFMICVDLGAGQSTTVDNFVIPCPPTTTCGQTNRFECEFDDANDTTPIPRTTDVTNELDVNGIPQAEEFVVTTIFSRNLTNPAQLSNLENFNTVSSTTTSIASAATTSNIIVSASESINSEITQNYDTTPVTTISTISGTELISDDNINNYERVVVQENNTNLPKISEPDLYYNSVYYTTDRITFSNPNPLQVNTEPFLEKSKFTSNNINFTQNNNTSEIENNEYAISSTTQPTFDPLVPAAGENEKLSVLSSFNDSNLEINLMAPPGEINNNSMTTNIDVTRPLTSSIEVTTSLVPNNDTIINESMVELSTMTTVLPEIEQTASATSTGNIFLLITQSILNNTLPKKYQNPIDGNMYGTTSLYENTSNLASSFQENVILPTTESVKIYGIETSNHSITLLHNQNANLNYSYTFSDASTTSTETFTFISTRNVTDEIISVSKPTESVKPEPLLVSHNNMTDIRNRTIINAIIDYNTIYAPQNASKKKIVEDKNVTSDTTIADKGQAATKNIASLDSKNDSTITNIFFVENKDVISETTITEIEEITTTRTIVSLETKNNSVYTNNIFEENKEVALDTTISELGNVTATKTIVPLDGKNNTIFLNISIPDNLTTSEILPDKTANVQNSISFTLGQYNVVLEASESTLGSTVTYKNTSNDAFISNTELPSVIFNSNMPTESATSEISMKNSEKSIESVPKSYQIMKDVSNINNSVSYLQENMTTQTMDLTSETKVTDTPLVSAIIDSLSTSNVTQNKNVPIEENRNEATSEMTSTVSYVIPEVKIYNPLNSLFIIEKNNLSTSPESTLVYNQDNSTNSDLFLPIQSNSVIVVVKTSTQPVFIEEITTTSANILKSNEITSEGTESKSSFTYTQETINNPDVSRNINTSEMKTNIIGAVTTEYILSPNSKIEPNALNKLKNNNFTSSITSTTSFTASKPTVSNPLKNLPSVTIEHNDFITVAAESTISDSEMQNNAHSEAITPIKELTTMAVTFYIPTEPPMPETFGPNNITKANNESLLKTNTNNSITYRENASIISTLTNNNKLTTEMNLVSGNTGPAETYISYNGNESDNKKFTSQIFSTIPVTISEGISITSLRNPTVFTTESNKIDTLAPEFTLTSTENENNVTISTFKPKTDSTNVRNTINISAEYVNIANDVAVMIDVNTLEGKEMIKPVLNSNNSVLSLIKDLSKKSTPPSLDFSPKNIFEVDTSADKKLYSTYNISSDDNVVTEIVPIISITNAEGKTAPTLQNLTLFTTGHDQFTFTSTSNYESIPITDSTRTVTVNQMTERSTTTETATTKKNLLGKAGNKDKLKTSQISQNILYISTEIASALPQNSTEYFTEPNALPMSVTESTTVTINETSFTVPLFSVVDTTSIDIQTYSSLNTATTDSGLLITDNITYTPNYTTLNDSKTSPEIVASNASDQHFNIYLLETGNTYVPQFLIMNKHTSARKENHRRSDKSPSLAFNNTEALQSKDSRVAEIANIGFSNSANDKIMNETNYSTTSSTDVNTNNTNKLNLYEKIFLPSSILKNLTTSPIYTINNFSNDAVHNKAASKPELKKPLKTYDYGMGTTTVKHNIQSNKSPMWSNTNSTQLIAIAPTEKYKTETTSQNDHLITSPEIQKAIITPTSSSDLLKILMNSHTRSNNNLNSTDINILIAPLSLNSTIQPHYVNGDTEIIQSQNKYPESSFPKLNINVATNFLNNVQLRNSSTNDIDKHQEFSTETYVLFEKLDDTNITATGEKVKLTETLKNPSQSFTENGVMDITIQHDIALGPEYQSVSLPATYAGIPNSSPVIEKIPIIIKANDKHERNISIEETNAYREVINATDQSYNMPNQLATNDTYESKLTPRRSIGTKSKEIRDSKNGLSVNDNNMKQTKADAITAMHFLNTNIGSQNIKITDGHYGLLFPEMYSSSSITENIIQPTATPPNKIVSPTLTDEAINILTSSIANKDSEATKSSYDNNVSDSSFRSTVQPTAVLLSSVQSVDQDLNAITPENETSTTKKRKQEFLNISSHSYLEEQQYFNTKSVELSRADNGNYNSTNILPHITQNKFKTNDTSTSFINNVFTYQNNTLNVLNKTVIAKETIPTQFQSHIISNGREEIELLPVIESFHLDVAYPTTTDNIREILSRQNNVSETWRNLYGYKNATFNVNLQNETLIAPETTTSTFTILDNIYLNSNRSTPSTNFTFDCTNRLRGRYGDNNDCRRFFICIGRRDPIDGLCPANTVFSEIKTQCTKNLSHCIRNNQFKCTTEGRFSDYLRDNVYFICVKNNQDTYFRFTFQCQKGYYLNKTSVRCAMARPARLSQSLSSNDSITENKSKEVHIIKEEFKCEKEGKFPDPENRRRYYECTMNKKCEFRRRRKECDKDEIFHKDKKKCIDSDSYESS